MRDVAIVATGMTPFGELWQSSLRDLFVDAALEALDTVGRPRPDSIYVGNMSGGQFVGQEHLGPLMADALGLAGIAATRVESACASGGAAIRTAMNDGSDVTHVLASAADQETAVYHGITFPGLYAMIARAHMERHGTTEGDLAAVAVKNHRHGAMNPKAQFRGEITLEQVMTSSMVAEPLRLLHCSPVSDGAAAVLLCPLTRAKEFTDKPVLIRGSGMATSSMALAHRGDPSYLDAVSAAAGRAYEAAGVSPSDLDLAEVHDCFTIAELCVLEAACLAERGEAAALTRAGETTLGGRLPINTSGGLKAKGHPVGATGVAQVIELVEQLRGEAGDRQVPDATLGMAQNMGGSGASSVVHILERV
jgi:acetyl-CoA C-acetyltransferase